MTISDLIPHVEALIFGSDKPLTTMEITELVNNISEEKILLDQVENAINEILEKYNTGNYPFEIKMSGGGWQFLTRKEFHKTVAQLNGDKFLKRLSTAALETLAIIAYKQPITKTEIEAIRGVNCDYTVQKLLEKELVIISGRNEKHPGQPLLYSTSKNFMDYFGINSPEELPKIKEVSPNEIVEPTVLKNTLFGEQAGTESDDESTLSVAEGGDLISNQDDIEGEES
jgi:segregation and condensation protein B